MTNLISQYKSILNYKIDTIYYIISFLALFSYLGSIGDFNIIHFLLIVIIGVYVLVNITDFSKIFTFIFFCYFINIGKWFTRASLTSGMGSRILFLDVLVILLLIHSLVIIFDKKRKFNVLPYYYPILIMSFIWIVNFLRGLPDGIGFAIGEARFYFFIIIMIAIVKNKFLEEEIVKFIKLILLASTVWLFKMILNINLNFVNFILGEITRFNPGGYGILILSLLPTYYFIKYRYFIKLFSFKDYVIFLIAVLAIFLAGVRTIAVILIFNILFIYFFSNKSMIKSIYYYLFALFIVFIIASSTSYSELFDTTVKSEGLVSSYNNLTTLNWRLNVWNLMLNDALSSTERFLFGRPFGYYMIDATEIGGGNWDEINTSTAHNDFVSFFMTNGIVFVLIQIFFYLSVYLKALKYIIENKKYTLYMIVFTTLLNGQILYSLTNTGNRHYELSLLIWIYVGFIINILNKKDLNPKELEAV